MGRVEIGVLVRRPLSGLLSLGLLACVAPGRADAQAPFTQPGYVQPYRPVVSPYLNLLRGGQGAALNYYNLVRPQVQFGNSIQQLQQQVTQNQQNITGLQQQQQTGIAPTGHPIQFLNHRQYFLNYGGTGGGQPGFAGGAGQGVAARPATPTAAPAPARPATAPSGPRH
jgi:hypothetical protein